MEIETHQEGPSILLADIQPIFRAGIVAILRKSHPKANFGHVSSFAEAHEKMHSQAWHLLICDIHLADRSGFELIHEARCLSVPIPSLVLSASPIQPFGRSAVKCGAAAYLPKDTSSEELLMAIGCLLAGQRYINGRLALALADATDENSEKPLHETLSRREMQVLVMLSEGKSLKKIASRLALSPKTVSTYRGRVIDKLKINSDADLVKYCLNYHLVPPFAESTPRLNEPAFGA